MVCYRKKGKLDEGSRSVGRDTHISGKAFCSDLSAAISSEVRRSRKEVDDQTLAKSLLSLVDVSECYHVNGSTYVRMYFYF